jgi:ketosteroid isomerase-like protein
MVKSKQIRMKRTLLSLTTVCLLFSNTNHSMAQINNQNKPKSKTMETVKTKQSNEVVQGFFTAFGNGDFNGVMNSFHDSCTVIGIRDAERAGSQIYGTYKGKEGAKTFLTNLGNTFDTKAFAVDHVIGNGNIAFANGKFTHVVKSTGKTFSSDWALMCVVKDDKIIEYHFYEDSEKFSEASK